MSVSNTLRIRLILAGLLATGIGVSILVAPAAIHAGYGTELGTDANFLSEIRAPGGALEFLFGTAFVPALVRAHHGREA